MGFVHGNGWLRFVAAVWALFDASAAPFAGARSHHMTAAFVARSHRRPSSRSVIGFSSRDFQGANANDNRDASKPEEDGRSLRRVVVQQISLDDAEELERMSDFCIGEFYGDDEEGGSGSLFSRKWKDFRLGAMRKAQLLDLALSTADNRCVFVAKDRAANNPDEIIGCCEVIEERMDVSPRSSSDIAASERERRRDAGVRPVIENLCVKEEHRRSGVASALLRACEASVESWPGRDEIFAQVGGDDDRAYRLFRKRGYQFLFADPTCTDVVLEDALFAKEVTVTKRMMRKFLSPSSP